MLEDHLEKGRHVAFAHVGIVRGVTVFGAGVHVREIQLLLGSVQREEKFEHLIMHPIRPGVVAVDFVDHHNRPSPALQRLAQHKPRLRLRTVLGVHQQQHTINHAQRPLHLAAEIRVARRIDDVDVMIAKLERRVLSLDGDALLALEIHGIHNAFLLGDRLIGAEGARLLQQTIHQRGFPVIHVRNNGNVSDMFHVAPPGEPRTMPVCGWKTRNFSNRLDGFRWPRIRDGL